MTTLLQGRFTKYSDLYEIVHRSLDFDSLSGLLNLFQAPSSRN